MKKAMSIILVFCMVLSLALTACAAEEAENGTTVVLKVGSPVMTVNGEEAAVDENGTVPVIVNGRTLLPVRALIEKMGGTVGWNAEEKLVTLNYKSEEIKLTIDSVSAYLNGEEKTLDTAPEIINGRTMLPIRFIAEGFNFSVEWNEEEKTVTVMNIKDKNITAAGNMAFIEGGEFLMGSPQTEAERSADEVQHEVRVSSFFISKTEVTQSEYESIMKDKPSDNKKGGNLPVENVTWYDAIAYCNALSEAEGLTPCYKAEGDTVVWDRSANGYRLPTEAEWEYAARAGSEMPFTFGDYVNDSDANCYNAYGYNNDASGRWVNGYLGNTVSVTSYNANANGLYNIHGNVSEWVWDWYGAYETGAQTDPTGAESGAYKVARGGGWNDMPKHLRSAYRIAYPADVPLYSIGIRVARNAEPGSGSVAGTLSAKPESKGGRVLITYFSQTGNTKGFADIIEEMTGADIFRIEREEPYSAAGNTPVLYGEALKEQRENAVPSLKAYLEDNGLDINDYDTILLGFCNWWASVPAPVVTFLNHYDLSGKTIIPFCSMGGGRFGQAIGAITKNAPNSTIKEGLCVSYSSYNEEEIKNWLSKSGIETK